MQGCYCQLQNIRVWDAWHTWLLASMAVACTLGATRAPARTVLPKIWVQLAAYLTPLMIAATGPVIASLATWQQGATSSVSHCGSAWFRNLMSSRVTFLSGVRKANKVCSKVRLQSIV